MPKLRRGSDGSQSSFKSESTTLTWSEKHSEHVYGDGDELRFKDEGSYVEIAWAGFDAAIDYGGKECFSPGDALNHLVSARAARVADMIENMLISVKGEYEWASLAKDVADHVLYQAGLLVSEVSNHASGGGYFSKDFFNQGFAEGESSLPHAKASIKLPFEPFIGMIDNIPKLIQLVAVEIFSAYVLYFDDHELHALTGKGAFDHYSDEIVFDQNTLKSSLDLQRNTILAFLNGGIGYDVEAEHSAALASTKSADPTVCSSTVVKELGQRIKSAYSSHPRSEMTECP